MLRGCITAIVTPMFHNGEIDYDSLTKFVNWQIDSGVSGLVVVGSTGESAALSEEEKFAIIKHVIEVNSGRVKVIVGSGTAATSPTLDFIRKVNQVSGVDYLMCLVPYYVKPTQDGLYQHFVAVAKESAYPVILYNVPSRTAIDLHDDTILRLANVNNIIGIKDATGDIKRCTYLLANKPEHFLLFSGDDASGLAFMLAGGNGVISVVSNICPQLFSQMCDYALSSNQKEALLINQRLIKLYDLLFIEANPIPVKWGLFVENRLKSATLRLPLTELSNHYHNDLQNALNLIKRD